MATGFETAACAALGALRPSERTFLSGMKRKDRDDVLHDLVRMTPPTDEMPLRLRVLQSDLPRAMRAQMFRELDGANDKYVLWVRRALELPLQMVHRSRGSTAELLARAQRILDANVVGHDAAKCEVLKLVCQRDGGRHALALEGPPGTGKTHFVHNALAPALDRPVVCVPLGGATDVGFLLGSLYVYEGSKEGRLAAGLVEARCRNPIFFFDEVDKVSATERGAEIINVLIHLTDPCANDALRDRYFHGIDLDFSKCTFVFAYNDATRVSPVLLDRLRRVVMPAPSPDARERIVRTALVPRAQKRLRTDLSLSDGAVARVLDGTKDGLRDTERRVEHVLSSAHVCKAMGRATGELVGTQARVLDDAHRVSNTFAAALLKARCDDNDAPPVGMYS